MAKGFCKNCGSLLNDGAKFCQNCGLPIDRTKKPTRPSTIIFWIAWIILALVCLIELENGFSFPRLICIGLILVLPLLLRKKLFIRLVPSLFCWAAVFVLFVLAMAAVDLSPDLNRSIVGETVFKQNGAKVMLLEGALPEGSIIKIDKDQNPYLKDVEGVDIEAFNIDLPQNGVVDGAAEIEIPFNKKFVPWGKNPKEILSAAYFNEHKNMWEPVPYTINENRGTVTIMTDHFSKYAVLYFKDGRKKLSETL